MLPVLIGAAGSAWASRSPPPAAASSASPIVSGAAAGLLGSSATFAPLVADTSLWFVRRRGIAVAICASGNYVAGADLAAHRAAAGREHRLARRLQHARRVSAVVHAAAGAGAGRRRRRRWPAIRGAAVRRSPSGRPFGLLDEPGAGAAVRGRHRLLRGDVDAAGAHRRLLRRPRLRRGAGAAMLSLMLACRRRQPARLGADLRPHRRPAHLLLGSVLQGHGAAAVPALRRAGRRCT